MTRLLLPQWLFARTAAHGTFITLYAANAAYYRGKLAIEKEAAV